MEEEETDDLPTSPSVCLPVQYTGVLISGALSLVCVSLFKQAHILVHVKYFSLQNKDVLKFFKEFLSLNV